MLKKVLCLLMVVSMLTSMVFATDDATNFEGYQGIKTSNITFQGMGTDGLTPGDEVTASVTAIKPEGEAQKAVFVLTLYMNKKMIDVAMSEEATIEATPVSMQASITIPEDASAEYELNASLVEPEYGFSPLSNPAYYPTRAEQMQYPLKSVSLDGENFVGFSLDETEYSGLEIVERVKNESDYLNNVKYHYYPEISAGLADLGIKLSESETEEYPGSFKLVSEFSDGSTAEHSFGIDLRKHSVKKYTNDSDFLMVHNELRSNESAVKLLPGLNGRFQLAYLYANLHGSRDLYSQEIEDAGSRWAGNEFSPFTDQRHQLTYIDPSLEGGDYYVVYGVWLAAKSTGTELCSFEIDCDSEISILTVNDTTFPGWSKASNKQWGLIRYMNADYWKAFEAIGLVPTYGFIDDWRRLPAGTNEEKLAQMLEKPEFEYIKTAYENADDAAKAQFTANAVAEGGWAGSLSSRNYKFVEIPEGQDSVTVTVPNWNEASQSSSIMIVVKPAKKVN